jgi:hypothetical protein
MGAPWHGGEPLRCQGLRQSQTGSGFPGDGEISDVVIGEGGDAPRMRSLITDLPRGNDIPAAPRFGSQ